MFGWNERLNQIEDIEDNFGSMGFYRNIFDKKSLRGIR
jgi:hypothetical protein